MIFNLISLIFNLIVGVSRGITHVSPRKILLSFHSTVLTSLQLLEVQEELQWQILIPIPILIQPKHPSDPIAHNDNDSINLYPKPSTSCFHSFLALYFVTSWFSQEGKTHSLLCENVNSLMKDNGRQRPQSKGVKKWLKSLMKDNKRQGQRWWGQPRAPCHPRGFPLKIF